VQELAAFALLTQATEPMLADQVLEIIVVGRGRVFVGAGGAKGAVTLHVGFACWSRRRDTQSVRGKQEGREGEVVMGSLVIEDLARKV
jgi:hypothetical protein